MGRVYAAPYSGTISNAGGNTDLLSLQPGDDKPCSIRGILLSQISEVGDAAEEGLRITLQDLPTTFTVGSGGSAITATRPPADFGGPVWGATARANDTTVATTNGTALSFGEIGWNIRSSPFDFWFPDKQFCVNVLQGSGLIVRLETTPADDLTGCFTFWFEEGC